MGYGRHVFYHRDFQIRYLKRSDCRFSALSGSLDENLYGTKSVFLRAARRRFARLLRRIGSALSRTLESQRAGAASRQSVAVGVGYRDYGVVKGSVNMRLTLVNLAYISLFSRYCFNCHVKPPYLAAFLLLETVRLGPFLVRAFCLDDCPRTGRFFLCLTPR